MLATQQEQRDPPTVPMQGSESPTQTRASITVTFTDVPWVGPRPGLTLTVALNRSIPQKRPAVVAGLVVADSGLYTFIESRDRRSIICSEQPGRGRTSMQ